MSKSAIQLLTLSICATALVVAPVVTPASAKTSSHKHTKIHRGHIYQNLGLSYARSADRTWPDTISSSRPGEVCPGIARSFDCKIWPPPIYEDPDRKMSGSDGG